jgi:hypothetical protein
VRWCIAFGNAFLPRNRVTPLFKGGLGEDVEELDGYGLKIRIKRKGRTEIFLVIIKTSPAAKITLYPFTLEHKCYEHITNV